MNSKKTAVMVILLAIAGVALFYFNPALVSASTSFLIGVIATFLICSSFSATTKSVSNGSNADTDTDTDNQSTQTLYVGNLPYKANESDVRQLFSEYSDVTAVRLMKDKRTGKRRGFGFVVVAKSDANDVVDTLNEKEYMQRNLKVRIANDPKHPEAGSVEQD